MIDFSYLQSVSIAFTVLYMLYRVFFNKLTFYTINRAFLLFILPVSLLVPFIEYQVSSAMYMHSASSQLLDVPFFEIEQVEESFLQTSLQFNWIQILVCIYVTGVLVKVFLIGKNLLKIYNLKQQSVYNSKEQFFTVNQSEVHQVFSFFGWIFIPVQKEADALILVHERLHASYLHTLDLIFSEIYTAFFWFNPLVYFFQKDLKAVHEFQVDATMVKSNYKTSEYLQLLLDNLMNHHKTIGLYNYFSDLTIQKRVKMMTQKKSATWKMFVYVAIIPAFAILTMSFTGFKTEYTTFDNPPSILPIKKGDFKRISSSFGLRVHPIDKEKRMHNGIDIPAKKGTPVVAAGAGEVINVVFKKGTYGKMIVVLHDKVYTTLYAQLSDYAVKVGDKVTRGQVIGYVGSSGKSTAPHLHYEVRKNGKPVNPIDYY